MKRLRSAQVGNGTDRDVRQRVYGTPVGGVTASPSLASRLDAWGWRIDGACAESADGGAAWFAQDGSLASRAARRACRSCPVQRVCLASALWFGEEYGIWGGTTPVQREAMTARLLRGESLDGLVGWSDDEVRDDTA
ncbi:WhiB family transcriptional regulator [Janibacter cremeus]|uniref:WhiB family transcriptional regulator n=1 Tax=Janibacter cremeus TaxID=1285192 RepID=UPI0023F6ED17|nr:WhiB family transcriptional regulator [Janibacter cremeus]WEV77732.1 WhiB family transcriptional regulator [Janibacter cremeus]